MLNLVWVFVCEFLGQWEQSSEWERWFWLRHEERRYGYRRDERWPS